MIQHKKGIGMLTWILIIVVILVIVGLLVWFLSGNGAVMSGGNASILQPPALPPG